MQRFKALMLSVCMGLTLVAGTVAVAGDASASVVAEVVRWKDGDTVVTSRGTVRLIGVDTPETGSCAAANATRLAKKWAPAGSRIRLYNPASVRDTDKYNRKLRYVETPTGRDVGLAQIRYGAKARYDNLDGYQHHPRQDRYRRADANHPNYRCSSSGSTDLRSFPPASKYDCPAKAPIKGNASSMIYHMPGQQYYEVTTPEECFATRAGAEHAGYRAAKV